MSLSKKLYDKILAYYELKSFGCLYFVNTLDRIKTKFDDRAEKAIFLGQVFGVKGYKVYTLTTHKFIVSRLVKFFEYIFPYNRNISDKEYDYDFVNDIDETNSASEKVTDIKR